MDIERTIIIDAERIIISFCLLFLCVAGFAQVEVRTIEDLQNVRNNPDGNFIQVADIDLEDVENWEPIGSEQAPFTGVYNGNGYRIRNLTIEIADHGYAALFGIVMGENARILNVGLENVDVTGTRPAARLVGHLIQGSQILQSYSSGVVQGVAGVGGLVGYVDQGTVVENSYAVGVVISEGDAGGLVAGNMGRVVNSYAGTYVDAAEGFAGGLNGRRTVGGETVNSFWDTNISSQQESNGGEGLATEQMTDQGSFRDWDMEDIWAIAHQETYPYLQWQREPDDHNYPGAGAPSNLVGVPGDEFAALTWTAPPDDNLQSFNIYRNDERYQSVAGNITEFQDQNVQNYVQYNYYVTAVFDDESESRASNTVRITPHEPFAGGEGTEEAPFQIATAQQLHDIRYQSRAHYIQIADVNLGVPPWNEGSGWDPIGYYESHVDNIAFSGSYDGNDFTISGLTIVDPDADHVGFFAYLSNAYLTDMTFEDVTIAANNSIGVITPRTLGENRLENIVVSGEIEGNNAIGGFVSSGGSITITNCHFHGSITGHTRVNGIVSNAGGSAVITDSGFTGDITGAHQFTTGIISNLQPGATIRGCYFDGNLTGGTDAGGLVGWNSGLITESYATGSIISTSSNVGGISSQTRGEGTVSRSFVDATVTGVRNVGGIVGYHGGSTNSPDVVITECYVRGSVVGSDNNESDNIAGIAGRSVGAITHSFSSARVLGPDNGTSGLIHRRTGGNVTNSYWDNETSGQANSDGGEGRLTRQMTYPYDQQTYQEWDFTDIWEEDRHGVRNDGYPYLTWQPLVTSPNPDVAADPDPEDRADNVSTDIEELRWTYTSTEVFKDPVGFRVYLDTTDEFDDDDYVWVDYVEEQENYSTSQILPEEIDYNTTYYWKVVPTTNDPDDRSSNENRRLNDRASHRHNPFIRGDAAGVPTWRFTTDLNPIPTAAADPDPEDEDTGINVTLSELSWKHHGNEDHVNPLGFRLYLNKSGEFGEDDEYEWVPFVANQTDYSNSDIVPEQLEYDQTYYWQVVPTTSEPQRNRRLSNSARVEETNKTVTTRNDADGVPVWSFTTIESEAYPQNAENPNPEDRGVGISVGLHEVSWEYHSVPHHIDPVGFRVYMNTTGQFGANAPHVWVEFEEGEKDYSSSDVVPDPLDPETTYYWRVIPTTTHPENRTSRSSNNSERGSGNLRGDAQDSPIWSFTTGETDVDDTEQISPLTNRLVSNYPNPFNPETTVSFELAEPAEVVIELFNSRGQLVRTLVDDRLEAGQHQALWDGNNYQQEPVSSGVYFSRMTVYDQHVGTQKMMMVK